MIHHTPSIICDFHCPVDFRLDILFPHIFWFLHQNRVGLGGFTLTKHKILILDILNARRVGAELHLETRSKVMGSSVILRIIFDRL
jgi:hypothetical protein